MNTWPSDTSKTYLLWLSIVGHQRRGDRKILRSRGQRCLLQDSLLDITWNSVTSTRLARTQADFLMRMGQSHTTPFLDEELKGINDCYQEEVGKWRQGPQENLKKEFSHAWISTLSLCKGLERTSLLRTIAALSKSLVSFQLLHHNACYSSSTNSNAFF